MIKTFPRGETVALFAGKRVARFANISVVATRQLQQIDTVYDVQIVDYH